MQEKKRLPTASTAGGAAFSLNVIVYLLLSLVATGLISACGLQGTDGAKYLSLLVSPVAIALSSVVFFRVTRAPVRSLLSVKTRPKYLLVGLMLIFGLLFSLNRLNEYLVRLFESVGYVRRSSTLPDFTGAKIVPALIVIAVIPAIAEEILFRGIVLNCAQNGVGSVRAVFLAGLCFSLYHGSVEQTVYQFVCGCLFALLAVRSRSVTPVVLAHFLNNAVIIAMCAFGLTDAVTGELLLPRAAEITLNVLSAVSLIGAVAWLVLDKTELKSKEQGGVGRYFFGAGVGIAVMAIIWVVNLF